MPLWGFMGGCKAALSNLIASDQIMGKEKIMGKENAFTSFSEAILNFYQHYCLDEHSSPWCCHDKVRKVNKIMFLINKHLFLYFIADGGWQPIQRKAQIHLPGSSRRL